MPSRRADPHGLHVSVVIPTLGNHDVLRRVLKALSQQDLPGDAFEVVVVADAAEPDPDEVQRAASSYSSNVRMARGASPGASANRNAGLGEARAPLVLFIDNDTMPTRSLLSQHVRWHERNEDRHVGVLGRVRWAPELDVTPFMRWLDMGIQFDFNIRGDEAGWGRFVTANVSLKREFAEQVGGFDQVRFPYGYEDTDWAYRASKQGFRLLYNRRAIVDHLRPMTLEFWQKRARRVASAENTFVTLYPELRPWFYDLFRTAQDAAPARGRGIRLAQIVSPKFPLIGPRVWASVDMFFKQALAPNFLDAWEEARNGAGSLGRPDLSEFET